MGSITNLDNDNIISATIEELSEEERQGYLVAEEHFMVQFLKGFKKDRARQVKRVQGLVIPTFKLNNNQVEPIHNVSSALSDLLSQLSLMMDQKIVDAQKSTCDLFVNMSHEIDNLKKGKSIDGTYSSDVLKPTPLSTPEPLYGMPLGYFAGQTPPPPSV